MQVIDVFGYAEGCPACERLKEYLTDKNIPFNTVNMERESQLRDEFRSLGYKTVPICYVDGYYIGGAEAVINQLSHTHGS